MKRKIGIIGAGVLGRLLAYQLTRRPEFYGSVTLFDRHSLDSQMSTSHAAGGMLAPCCEAVDHGPAILSYGERAIEQWSNIVKTFESPVRVYRQGTLIVSHPQDHHLLNDFRRKLEVRAQSTHHKLLDSVELKALFPQKGDQLRQGILVPSEGHLNPIDILRRLGEELRKSSANIRENVVAELDNHIIHTPEGSHEFDLVVDCRGIDAANDLLDLRAVRGEAIMVRAPEITIRQPIRILHPRFILYIVPRGSDQYYLGATSIESSKKSGITVTSTLEILTAAYTVSPLFGEAEILATKVGLRPAFPNNLPKIVRKKASIHVNGLYRHGFLVSPTLVEQVMDGLSQDVEKPHFLQQAEIE